MFYIILCTYISQSETICAPCEDSDQPEHDLKHALELGHYSLDTSWVALDQIVFQAACNGKTG